MNRIQIKDQVDQADNVVPVPGGHGVKIVLAFAAIYVIWGTTYLAMRIAVETLPPFLIAGSRFVIAGLLLIGYLRIRGVPHPAVRQWRSAALIGCLLMVGGNGLVMWAVQTIPSGICAVVVATMPLWMTVFDWRFYGGPQPTWVVSFGLLLGLAGIVLLMGPAELLNGETTLHLSGMLALIGAPIFWSIGSLQSRKMDLPANVFMATAAEMICGGLALITISIAFGEPARLYSQNLQSISWQSLGAVAYLTIFGSLIALTSYMWLLKNAPVARIATYTYINPVIAMFLGWWILDEPITIQTVIAVAVIVSAVAMIVTARKR